MMGPYERLYEREDYPTTWVTPPSSKQASDQQCVRISLALLHEDSL